MTKDELRKIFDDAEKGVLNSDTYQKLIAELNDPKNNPPADKVALAIRVNRILDREIFLEVMSKILADKNL